MARSSLRPVSALVGLPGLAQPPCHLLGLPVRSADLLVELDLIEANGCPTGWTAEPRAASQVGRPSSNRVPIGTDKVELLIVRQSYGGASTPNDTRGCILRLTGQAGPWTFRVGGPNSRDAALPSSQPSIGSGQRIVSGRFAQPHLQVHDSPQHAAVDPARFESLDRLEHGPRCEQFGCLRPRLGG